MLFYLLLILLILIVIWNVLAGYFEFPHKSVKEKLTNAAGLGVFTALICFGLGIVVIMFALGMVRDQPGEITSVKKTEYTLAQGIDNQNNSPLEVNGGNLKFVSKDEAGNLQFNEIEADLIGISDGKKTTVYVTEEEITISGFAPWPVRSTVRVLVK